MRALLSIGFFLLLINHVSARNLLPLAIVVTTEQTYLTEIAITPHQQSQGLMYRTWIPPWQAMLFSFTPTQKTAFWMQNTLIPLDIHFYRQDGSLIVSYLHALPCYKKKCSLYSSREKTSFVLETRPKYQLISSSEAILAIERLDR